MEYNLWKSVLLDWVSVDTIVFIFNLAVVHIPHYHDGCVYK